MHFGVDFFFGFQKYAVVVDIDLNYTRKMLAPSIIISQQIAT
jgi:hypothetical protein